MSGSPGEQSGLLVTLALATMVVKITKLGIYRSNVSASLHIVYWGIYTYCSLLRCKEKHRQHPVLSPPLIKCTSGIIASIQIYINGRANLLSPYFRNSVQCRPSSLYAKRDSAPNPSKS